MIYMISRAFLAWTGIIIFLIEKIFLSMKLFNFFRSSIITI